MDLKILSTKKIGMDQEIIIETRQKGKSGKKHRFKASESVVREFESLHKAGKNLQAIALLERRQIRCFEPSK
jgi:hypothetical protein